MIVRPHSVQHSVFLDIFYVSLSSSYRVEKPLLEQGWQRIDDNKDLSYYLKWVECKSRIDYKSFRAGNLS